MRRTVLRGLLSLPLLLIGGIELRGQNPPAASSQAGAPLANTQPASSTAPTLGDRFPELRAEADRLKSAYESENADSMAEIDSLLQTKRCQIARIDGDLRRLKDKMNAWLTAEKQYWNSWNDKETQRVEVEKKSQANIEAEQASAAALVDADTKDREELLRRRAALQQGEQTDAVRQQMDSLAADIQDADKKLADAKKAYDLATDKLNNSQAALTVRLVQIRQNISQLDSYGVSLDAIYETKRTAAQDICDQKAPDSKQPTARKGQQ